MSDRPIYERLEDETQKAWEAFCVYRNMGRTRSLERAGQELGKTKANMERYSRTYRWMERVAAFDVYYENLEREVLVKDNIEKHKQDLERYRAGNKALGEALRGTAIELLQILRKDIEGLKAKQIKTKDCLLDPKEIGILTNSLEKYVNISDRLLTESLGVEKLLQKMIEDEEEQG